MKRSQARTTSASRVVAYIVAGAAALVTLAISPAFNLDPINLPKLLVLAVGAFALVGYLIKNLSSLDKVSLALSLVFLLFMLIAIFSSEKSFFEQIFGTYGRNTGFLTYLSLSIIFLTTLNFYSEQLSKYLIVALIGTGLINLVYGYFQGIGLDPINWNNKYNPIIGTLGNPNFLSAHLGFATLATAGLLVAPKIRIAYRLTMSVLLVAALVLIYQSDSIQGLAIFAIGIFIILYFRFFRHRKVLSILYIALGSVSIVFGVFGTLQIGPLARFLYQESVTYRGDYWRAGIEMMEQNPLTGVGMDAYGDWYRVSRTIDAVNRRGPDVVSNSAHNVFIDIGSNGGIPLLVAYIGVFSLVVFAMFRVVRHQVGYSVYSAILISVWITYVIQSIISINQIGLAIWGWTFAGAIIGHQRYLYQTNENANSKPLINRLSPTSLVMTGLIGFMIAIWPITKDAAFRTALTSRSVTQLERAAVRFPETTYHLDYASSALAQNQLYEESLALSKQSVEINPRNFNAWVQIFRSPSATDAEKRVALEQLRLLDPNNPELK